MEIVKAESYDVVIGSIVESGLEDMLTQHYSESRKFIMVDNNTLQHCFPYLAQACPSLSDAEIIELEAGESSKNIDTCVGVWKALSDLEASRNDLIINLGGGVIGDMGGFIAATFKRGMRFIHIPTTLLSQVDASIGGKLGIDLDHVKNMVGLICNPQAVYIDGNFLRTLGGKELTSGLAEIIKHGLVADKDYWQKIKLLDYNRIDDFIELIPGSVHIKNNIVQIDPYEHAERKALNFGHTIGHAVEAYSMESELRHLLHGEAIAIGMICEAFLSHKKKLISTEERDEIVDFILPKFPKFVMNEVINHRLIEFMKKDKKNKGGNINFTLLDGIGSASIDNVFDVPDIFESLAYYQGVINEA